MYRGCLKGKTTVVETPWVQDLEPDYELRRKTMGEVSVSGPLTKRFYGKILRIVDTRVTVVG